MTFRCNCGHNVEVPSENAVVREMLKLGFAGEITLKQPCPSCGQRQFTSYRTDNERKGIDNPKG